MMKKLSILCIVGIFLGCNQKDETSLEKSSNDSIIKEELVSDTIKPISTDTVFFNYKDEFKYSDYALIYLINKKRNKNKIATASYRISFFQDKKLLYKDQFDIKGYEEGSVFSGNYVLDSIQSPFKLISLGYPACGYSATNFLFFIDGNKSSKVHSWSSTADGGWFFDVEFHRISKNKFYAYSNSFWPVEELTKEEIEANQEMGLIEHSDSIVFTFNKNKWMKELKTQKGKVYYSKRMSYSTYHNFNVD